MKHLSMFKRIAEAVADESSCAKYHVGAVIFDDKHRVLSTGYNGTVSGVQNCNDVFMFYPDTDSWLIKSEVNNYIKFSSVSEWPEDWLEVTKDEWDRVHKQYALCYEVHAEQNAIYNLIKTGTSLPEDSYMYCTLEPCDQCAKAIRALGIKKVYVGKKHRAAQILKYRTVYMED